MSCYGINVFHKDECFRVVPVSDTSGPTVSLFSPGTTLYKKGYPRLQTIYFHPFNTVDTLYLLWWCRKNQKLYTALHHTTFLSAIMWCGFMYSNSQLLIYHKKRSWKVGHHIHDVACTLLCTKSWMPFLSLPMFINHKFCTQASVTTENCISQLGKLDIWRIRTYICLHFQTSIFHIRTREIHQRILQRRSTVIWYRAAFFT